MANNPNTNNFDPNAGYHRYFGAHKPFWYNMPGGQWRQPMIRELTKQNASCFWLSMCSIAPSHGLLQIAVRAERQDTPAGVTSGKTYVEAVGLCQGHDLRVGVIQVARVGPSWAIVRRWHHPQAPTRGTCLVLVEHNDLCEYAPHWCACTSYRPRFTIPFTLADEWAAAERDGRVRARRERGQLIAAVDDDDLNLDLLYPDEFQPEHRYQDITLVELGIREWMQGFDALLNDPDVEGERVVGWDDLHPDPGGAWIAGNNAQGHPIAHPLNGIFAVCGVFPPPMPTTGLALVSTRRFFRVAEAGYRAFDSGDLISTEGHPTAVDRAVARTLGEGGICWELRPSVMEDMHVSSRHYVYVKLGQRNAVDDRFLESGDYNPARVARLTTETGLYSLVDPRDLVTAAGEEFRVFRLHRCAATITGCLARLLPLHLEKVTGITERGAMILSNPAPRTAFPNAASWLRAQFQIIAAKAPEELVPLINDQRNQALAALVDGSLPQNFDPYFLVMTLHEQLARAERLFRVLGKSRVFSVQ